METQPCKPQTDYGVFDALDIRIGTIIEAMPFPQARKPSYQLGIDFGSELGIKQSSAQITQAYTLDELIGKKVVAVVNFPPKRIASFVSEVLILGVNNVEGNVVLLEPNGIVANGTNIY